MTRLPDNVVPEGELPQGNEHPHEMLNITIG